MPHEPSSAASIIIYLALNTKQKQDGDEKQMTNILSIKHEQKNINKGWAFSAKVGHFGLFIMALPDEANHIVLQLWLIGLVAF